MATATTYDVVFTRTDLPKITLYGFVDDFNRTANTLGVTSREVKPWALSTTATAGVDGTRAYMHRSTAGPLQATAEASLADGTLTTKLAVVGTTNQCGLSFRSTGTLNYWRFTAVTKVLYRLEKIIAGTTTVVASTTGITPADGDVLSVVLTADTILCKRNGVTIISTVDAHNQTATKHGLYNSAADNVARFDSVSFV